MTQWFAEPEFWSDFYPAMFSPARAAEAAAIVADSPLFDFAPGTDILDLCCGPGLFVRPLAERGCAVTGVDSSAELLSRAAAACEAAGVKAELERADMRTFRRAGAFDAVVNLWTSFGYFDDPQDDLRVLRNIRASLRPGGRFLLDVVGKEVLARTWQPVTTTFHDDLVLVQRDTVEEDWTRLRSDWVLVDGERVRRASLRLRLFSAAELTELLCAAGFSAVRCYGDYAGGPYGPDATRLIAVAS